MAGIGWGQFVSEPFGLDGISKVYIENDQGAIVVKIEPSTECFDLLYKLNT